MTEAQRLAAFITGASFRELSDRAVEQLKIRVLDSLGCAVGALGAPPLAAIRAQIQDFDGEGRCTLIGGGRASPDRAALYNSALVRYLDFNDSYLARGETCHPSDNLGAVLAAGEYRGISGSELLVSLAAAYQVQCRLSDVAPVRARGFDHTTQGSYAVAAGVSRALGLDEERTAHAVAICGTAFNALRVTRTGALSNWKGLAYPNTAFGCTHAAFLAMRGVTGPLEVFEGNKGFKQAIAGDFSINWMQEDLERVTRTAIKRYNAEVHSQSVLEGLLELRREHGIRPQGIDRVDIQTFDVAYHIIGGGEEGDKKTVRTKEEADHSLPYLAAVALIDGTVMPGQYAGERITGRDVQDLLRRVNVTPSRELSGRFPDCMPCAVTVVLKDGARLRREKQDYEGYHTNPMRWETVVDKFTRLTGPFLAERPAGDIIDAVQRLDRIEAAELMELLGSIR
jgi:2-methylcitrate dehydratase